MLNQIEPPLFFKDAGLTGTTNFILKVLHQPETRVVSAHLTSSLNRRHPDL
jgi:hypothetical protein